MSITSEDMIKNCAACFQEKGWAVRLEADGPFLVCPYDKSHRYVIHKGLLRRV
ncbi:MAG: hypothetical protein QXG98_04935 [Candidatus Micrarchaeia archaeon]